MSTTSETKQAVAWVEPLSRRYTACLLPCPQISKRGRSPYHGFDVRTSAQALANLEPEVKVPLLHACPLVGRSWAANEPDWPCRVLA